MPDKFEVLIKEVYRRNKLRSPVIGAHLDEEDFAVFLDGALTESESESIKAHLMSCDSCAEILALSINANAAESVDLPESLISRIKEILSLKNRLIIFEVFLRIKDNILEVVNSTGDILVGQELIPAPVLRSRNIKDFKDEIIILKDLKDLRIEVKVASKGGQNFDLTVKVKHKDDQTVIKNLRATLLKDDLELESYLSDTGLFTFEHVLLGNYTLEVFSDKERLASVALEVKE